MGSTPRFIEITGLSTVTTMHRRTLTFLLPAVTALALAGCATSGVPMPAPNLTGIWVPMGAELSGRYYDLANFRRTLLEVKPDGSYEFAGDKGGITLLPGSAPPYKMDIVGKQGPNAGRTILASYAMDGEELTVCYQLARDGERPASLNSPADSQILLIRYKRQNPLRG
jgi:uncharacterized protein (TIGR03067 family)